MTTGFKRWWNGRTLREQRLLLVMGGVATIVLAWLLIVRPLSDALSTARERHGRAVVALAEVRAQADRIGGIEGGGTPVSGQPLDSLLASTATDAGIQIRDIARQGAGRATIGIAAVRPQALFGWVERMESGERLIVERLAVTANPDQTLAAEITFRTRGG